jgi:predicted transposase YbfD/YdcC
MPPMHGWKSVRQCFKIIRTRTCKKRGTTSTQTVYGITSLPPERADAKRLLHLNRRHWSIENRLQWVKDTLLREDASTIRTRNAPVALCALRNYTLTMLHRVNSSPSIARERCSIKPTVALNQLLAKFAK